MTTLELLPLQRSGSGSSLHRHHLRQNKVVVAVVVGVAVVAVLALMVEVEHTLTPDKWWRCLGAVLCTLLLRELATLARLFQAR